MVTGHSMGGDIQEQVLKERFHSVLEERQHEHASSSRPSRHWRSQSAPDIEESLGNWDISPQAFHSMKKSWTHMKRHLFQQRKAILKKDVAQLEMKLQDQLSLRKALEKALVDVPSSIPMCVDGIPKQTEKIIEEISALEFEVAQLEQHLLLLYRKVFQSNFPANLSEYNQFNERDDTISTDYFSGPLPLSNEQNPLKPASAVQRSHSSLSQGSSGGSFLFSTAPKHTQKYGENIVQRSQSSLSHVSTSSSVVKQSSPSEDSLNDSFNRTRHSQRLFPGFEGRIARLADHLGTSISNHVPESPNRLSEDLVHFMAAIYCKLSEPPLPHAIFPNSPTSSLASSAVFSPQDQFKKCSDAAKNAKPDVKIFDPFGIKADQESIGGYSSMIEVPWICSDNDRLSYAAAQMLHNFKSLVRRLDKVDPSVLKHDEKLAFWINIYNTLMMHAYLAYGIPRNHLKRLRLLQKAAYKIGGISINANMIENVILGCRLYRPSQWLQSLLLGGVKSKGVEEIKTYTIGRPEPLVCFSLCSGNHSDPAVRVYTAKNVHSELEVARDEYLKASIGIKKGNKLLLPKILDVYCRELSLGESDLVNMACQFLSEVQRNSIKKISPSKLHKSFEWLPYSMNFRYIFSRDLGKWIPPLIT